jgi:hypothetical protein
VATAWALSGILLVAALLAPPDVPPAEDALSPAQMRHREMTVMATVSSVAFAEKEYAAVNGSFFDEIACLTDPVKCIPGFDANAAPFLDPTYAWLEPRLGYNRAFHAGPKADPAAIARAKASPSSLRAFAFTATPIKPGVSGIRAFCADSTGRRCMTKDGSAPPVKSGACDPCQKIQ